MPAKLRQLGWMFVAPTPLTHACADAGRSGLRAVAPMNTMRATGVVEPGELVGDGGLLEQARVARPTVKAACRAFMLTAYSGSRSPNSGHNCDPMTKTSAEKALYRWT